MKRPLLRGNHSSVGLSAPRSLISCGTTSESTCRAAITQALGALGRRKMDLEGICGQSSPSLLCIRRHSTSTALVQGFPPTPPPPSPLLPSIYLFCQALCWMAVKRYKLKVWATSNKANWYGGAMTGRLRRLRESGGKSAAPAEGGWWGIEGAAVKPGGEMEAWCRLLASVASVTIGADVN